MFQNELRADTSIPELIELLAVSILNNIYNVPSRPMTLCRISSYYHINHNTVRMFQNELRADTSIPELIEILAVSILNNIYNVPSRPMTLGRISSYYYINHNTVRMFQNELRADTSIPELIEILAVSILNNIYNVPSRPMTLGRISSYYYINQNTVRMFQNELRADTSIPELIEILAVSILNNIYNVPSRPMTLGRISSYYYINHNTVRMFQNELRADTSIPELIEILAVSILNNIYNVPSRPMTLGRISSYYYINHNTVRMFQNELRADTSIPELIEILAVSILNNIYNVPSRPMTLGRISSYYYINHNTVRMFQNELRADTSIPELIEILAVSILNNIYNVPS